MPNSNQKTVDDIVSQVQAETNALTEEASQALAGAAATAGEIAGDIDAVVPGAAAAQSAPGESPAPTAAPEMAAIPEDIASLPADLSSALSSRHEVHRLLAIEVPVIVQLGTRRLTVAEVMRFAVGAIIEFNKSAEEELELLANNKPIGKGQAVKVGENFGIKISSIGSVKEVIRKLGAA